MSVRAMILAAVAATLVLAAGDTAAQPPPAGPDVDRRLKAVENKLDLVLKLLEARADPAATTVASLEGVRDTLRAELRDREANYNHLLRTSPLPLVRTEKGMITRSMNERLAKYESQLFRSTGLLKEYTDQIAQVEAAYAGGKNRQAALRIVLGVKIADLKASDAAAQVDKAVEPLTERRKSLVKFLGEGHPAVKEVDGLIAAERKAFTEANDTAADGEIKLFLATARCKAHELTRSVTVYKSLAESEAKMAREMEAFETRLEQSRIDVANLRRLVAVVGTQIEGRPAAPKK